jgi:AcrR family transcriptional regulator
MEGSNIDSIDTRTLPVAGTALDTDDDVDSVLEDDEIQSEDGRRMRRTRNRDSVIVALLDIVSEGELEPSVADIADRAGVSHRSVFRYFTDINDLVRTAIDFEVQRALPLAIIPDIGLGSLERRVDAWVDSRLRIYAATAEVSRVARLRSANIPSIDDGMRAINEMVTGRLRQNFAKELDRLGADGGFVIDAAMVLTSFEAYDLHTRIYGHSIERIRQVWHLALRTLFALTPATN